MNDDEDTWETATEFRQRCGNVSRMTLHRWARSFPDFPKPTLINGRRYFRKADRIAFMERRASEASTGAA